MIIDLRTRIWSKLDLLGTEVANQLRRRYADRWNMLDGSAAGHDRASGCVTASCVLGFRSDLLGATLPNEVIAEFVAGDPRRRVGIAGIDPMSPNAMTELEKAVHLGLCGVCLSPGAQGYHPAHSLAMRVYERCAELHLPVFVTNDIPHSASTVLEFARPYLFDEVARSVPALKLVIGEMGWPWVNETIALIAKHPNIYADVACLGGKPWELYNALVAADGAEVMDKILFGSGGPFVTPSQAIEAMYSLNAFAQGTHLPTIQRSLIRSIIERDSLQALGIESEISNQRMESRTTDESDPFSEMAHAAAEADEDDDAE